MGAMDLILQDISTNFMLYFVLTVGLIIIIVISRILTLKYKIKAMDRMAEIEKEKYNLEIASKRVVIDELRNASIILSPEERKKLQEIQMDNAILSRKLLYHMNEAEERMKRVELGSENYAVIKTIEEIKDKEKTLFGRGLD